MPDTGTYECRANYIENEDYNSQEKMIDVLGIFFFFKTFINMDY